MLSTHYMEEADVLCDRLAIIDSGEIVAMDTPQKLKKTFTHCSFSFIILSDSQTFNQALHLDFGIILLNYFPHNVSQLLLELRIKGV